MTLYETFQEKLKPYGDMTSYINFCLEHSTEYSRYKTQRHHILPKCLFPEYKSFKNEWNIVNLSNEDHYIAHYLLAKLTEHPSLISAWYAMNNKNFSDVNVPIKLIGPKQYSELIKVRNKMTSERNRNKVLAKDLTTGEILRVSKEEFDSNPNLVGATKGRGGEHFIGKHLTTMINLETGKPEKINPKNVDRTKYVGITKGYSVYKDKNGNRVFTRTDDPRVLSRELVGISSGTHVKQRPYERTPRRKFVITNLEDNSTVEIFKKQNFVKYLKENNINLRETTNLKVDKYRFKNNEWRKIE